MDAEGNQYKQSGFSQIKTLHEAFLFNNTLILRRNVPADPTCSNKLSIWRQLLLASSHTKKDSPTTRWNCPRHFPRSALQKSLSESASNRFPVCAWNNFWHFFITSSSFCRIKKKARKFLANQRAFFGRSSGIWTHGLLVPNEARYQLRYAPKIPQLIRLR